MPSSLTGDRTAPVTDAQYRALAKFRRNLRAFLHFSEQAAKSAGLTPSQHQLLLAIRGSEGNEPPSIGEMAEVLKLRHHSTVELVDRAVSAGLVQRVIDPDDHRRQRLELTSVGLERLEALTSLHRDELRRFRAEVIAALNEL